MAENYYYMADKVLFNVAKKKVEFENQRGKPPTELIIGLDEYYYLRRYMDDYAAYNVVHLYGDLNSLTGMELHVASEKKSFVGVSS